MIYVLIPHMKTEPSATAPPNGPDPLPDRTAASSAPSRSGELLSLVHDLIAFGQALIHTLQSSPAAEALLGITRRFGTPDLTLIIARITRGLLLAANLDARLLRCASRLDIPPNRTAAMRGTDHRKRRAPGGVDTQSSDDAALLARLPTAQEIAASVRGKPIGIVLEEICRDFAITCDQPVWRDLRIAILTNGGRWERILDGIQQRLHAGFVAAPELYAAPTPSPERASAPRAASTATRVDNRLDAALAGSRVTPSSALFYAHARTSTGPP